MTFDWISFVIGYLFATIVGVIVEVLCIISGRSDIDKWMYEEVESELNRSKEETPTPRD